MIPIARRTSTQREWHLWMPVGATCTSFGTKAQSKQAPLLSNSFPRVSRVALTPQTRELPLLTGMDPFGEPASDSWTRIAPARPYHDQSCGDQPLSVPSV